MINLLLLIIMLTKGLTNLMTIKISLLIMTLDVSRPWLVNENVVNNIIEIVV